MDELSELALEADPIVVAEGEAPEGQEQDQTADAPEAEEKKSAAAARRERDKAYKARLIEEKGAVRVDRLAGDRLRVTQQLLENLAK